MGAQLTDDAARRCAVAPVQWLARVLCSTVLMALIVAATAQSPAAHAESTSEGSAASDQTIDPCGDGVNAVPQRSRHVNLVLDDSGSMFVSNANPIDSWSAAKYSVEVFAAMLAAEDTLHVYLTSDFTDGSSSGPAVQVQGSSPLSDRVAQVHSMTMVGGGTPYAPVEQAAADLASSSAPEKWLVVLSDGEFDDRDTSDLQADLVEFATENSTEDTEARVAFLALGDAAPQFNADPEAGVFFQFAADSSRLLDEMTGFANQIFGRSVLDQHSSGQASIDIDMEQVMVFAQGEGVSIGDLNTSEGTVSARASVDVAGTDNPDAQSGGDSVPAVPNPDFQGTLAVYEDIAHGVISVDVEGAQTVELFYQPRIAFGIELQDSSGEMVDSDKIVGGEYTVHYGFMDRNCSFIDSELLGDPTFAAQVTHDGEVIATDFAPGDSLELERGEVTLDVHAEYLGGASSEASVALNVLQPARPTMLEMADKEYQVSQLNDYSSPADAMDLTYAIEDNDRPVAFTEEEWASFSLESFTVTSEENLDFEVAIGDEPGSFYVLPRAPDGDVYAAATGEVPFTVEVSHVYDEQLHEISVNSTLSIEDDISFMDRLTHWFFDVGWKYLLALLVLIILAGYVFRRRLPRNLKNRPMVHIRPKTLSGRPEQDSGRVQRHFARKLLPYLAETGTIKYMPSMAPGGFPPLKVKAAGGRRMTVTNWQAVANGENVSFNGERLTKDTPKAPVISANTEIKADAEDAMYTTTLTSSLRDLR